MSLATLDSPVGTRNEVALGQEPMQAAFDAANPAANTGHEAGTLAPESGESIETAITRRSHINNKKQIEILGGQAKGLYSVHPVARMFPELKGNAIGTAWPPNPTIV